MFFLLLSLSLVASQPHDVSFLKNALDDMENHYVPGKKFDRVYFEKLLKCFAKYDDELLIKSQNNAWKEIQSYFGTNGTSVDYMGKSDHWGECTPYVENTRCPVGPYQRNSSETFGQVEVIEPCNYVSNIAYYHSVTRTCDYPDWSIKADHINGIKRAFAALATGSAFWHGSHTYVGYSFDNNMIAVIAYLGYQASVSPLPGNSTILKELSPTPRSKTGLQVSEDLVQMFSEKKVPEWAQILDTADLPHVYELTFAAIISLTCSLIYPWFLTYYMIKVLAYLLIPPDKNPSFIVNEYLPELQVAVQSVQVSLSDKKTLLTRFTATLMKILFAFMWQEFFIPLPFLYNSVGQGIGALIMPYWNDLAWLISGVKQTDKSVNTATSLYPGDSMCRKFSPHALWHEESANGLLDLVFLTDYIHEILQRGRN